MSESPGRGSKDVERTDDHLFVWLDRMTALITTRRCRLRYAGSVEARPATTVAGVLRVGRSPTPMRRRQMDLRGEASVPEPAASAWARLPESSHSMRLACCSMVISTGAERDRAGACSGLVVPPSRCDGRVGLRSARRAPDAGVPGGPGSHALDRSAICLLRRGRWPTPGRERWVLDELMPTCCSRCSPIAFAAARSAR